MFTSHVYYMAFTSGGGVTGGHAAKPVTALWSLHYNIYNCKKHISDI